MAEKDGFVIGCPDLFAFRPVFPQLHEELSSFSSHQRRANRSYLTEQAVSGPRASRAK
jgi:hypothetical protein